MTRRREFLVGMAGAIAGVVGLPVSRALGLPRVAGGGDLAPGEAVRVLWPRGLDWRKAVVAHSLDGVRTGTVAAPEPTGLLIECLEVRASPPDGRLRPGRHEFSLLVGGRALRLGGFDIAPFRFGF